MSEAVTSPFTLTSVRKFVSLAGCPEIDFA
jgi:hypothetical protein